MRLSGNRHHLKIAFTEEEYGGRVYEMEGEMLIGGYWIDPKSIYQSAPEEKSLTSEEQEKVKETIRRYSEPEKFKLVFWGDEE